MDIDIKTNSLEPVYEQIVRQIHEGVRSGALSEGAPLPTVRQLADDLRLNRNTVARAYKTLEQDGVIQTAGRRGTFIRDRAAQEVTTLRAGRARRVVHHMIENLLRSGMSRREISDIVTKALASRATPE